MEYRADLDALAVEQEVLLFATFGGDQVMCLARRHWFATETPGERRMAWQSTWDGKELPREWAPYAYGIAKAPDPALLEEGY